MKGAAPPSTPGAGHTVTHPAKFSAPILTVIRDVLTEHLTYGGTILDPFGGAGGIHDLIGYDTFAVELEHEWAGMSIEKGWSWCGDWFKFDPDVARFSRTVEYGVEHGKLIGEIDAIVTSCTYANRMADHHNATDASRRMTYKHALGRDLSPGNSGAMQWGNAYKSFHRRAWKRAWELLPDDGLLILNVSNHVRKGEVVPVTQFHIDAIEKIGFEFVKAHHVKTQRMGFGANRDIRVDHESVLVYRK